MIGVSNHIQAKDVRGREYEFFGTAVAGAPVVQLQPLLRLVPEPVPLPARGRAWATTRAPTSSAWSSSPTASRGTAAAPGGDRVSDHRREAGIRPSSTTRPPGSSRRCARRYPTERETDAHAGAQARSAAARAVRARLACRAGRRPAGAARRDGRRRLRDLQRALVHRRRLEDPDGLRRSTRHGPDRPHDAADGPGRVAQRDQPACASSSCCAAFDGVLPVPPVYWVDDDARLVSRAGADLRIRRGVTKPRRRATGAVSGIGTNFGPELRAQLAPQFCRHLAAIHTFDAERPSSTTFDRPRPARTESALWQLNRARRMWEEDRGEDFPLMEVAANWLERNLPELDRVSVVHGDYRSGNFLFDEDTARDHRLAGLGARPPRRPPPRSRLDDARRSAATTPRTGTYLVCGLVRSTPSIASTSGRPG